MFGGDRISKTFTTGTRLRSGEGARYFNTAGYAETTGPARPPPGGIPGLVNKVIVVGQEMVRHTGGTVQQQSHDFASSSEE